MLSNLNDFRALLSLSATVTAPNALLEQLLEAADRAVKSYCKRNFESATYTEYRDGNGLPDLPLLQRPVTTVTSVRMDNGGYYGYGVGAFPTSSQLTAGVDYALVLDDPAGGKSKSGILKRLGGMTGSGSYLDWPGSYGFRRGTLTARRAPSWPNGQGNIKIVYAAGYAAGSIPDDLQQAVNQLAAEMYRNGKFGGMPLQSESLGAYSYSLATQLLQTMGSTLRLLSNYREVSL